MKEPEQLMLPGIPDHDYTRLGLKHWPTCIKCGGRAGECLARRPPPELKCNSETLWNEWAEQHMKEPHLCLLCTPGMAEALVKGVEEIASGKPIAVVIVKPPYHS